MLQVKELRKVYPHKTIGSFNFDFEIGHSIVIIGPSGSGKTTFIKMLANIVEPTSGSVKYKNQKLEQEEIMYISQEGTLFNHLTIDENLRLTFRGNINEIISILKRLKLDETYLNKYPFELSGGERQRIDITRALLSEAKLLILDEVFSALDSHNKEKIAQLLAEIKTEYELTIMLITHDIYDALYIADKIIVIDDGQVKFFGDSQGMLETDVLIKSNLISQRQLKILKKGVL